MFIKRLPKFEYHAPSTKEETLKILSQCNGKGKVIAGGTDLLVSMKKRDITPEYLINLKTVEGLQGITYKENEGVRIGALTTIGEIERSEIIKEKFLSLWDSVKVMASPQVRNLGTIGGNLCSAIPSADTAPPLIVLGASLTLLGTGGERNVKVEDFFKGPAKSILGPAEIVTEIFIPDSRDKTGSAYVKLMRRNAMDLALVGAAAFLKMDGDGNKCEEARIALGAVAPTPIRSTKAEELLINKGFSDKIAAEAGEVASQEAAPISDIRASKEYRKEMVKVLTKRAILMARNRIN